MRCKACDYVLSDYESTIKNEVTGEYEDMCLNCLELSESVSDTIKSKKDDYAG